MRSGYTLVFVFLIGVAIGAFLSWLYIASSPGAGIANTRVEQPVEGAPRVLSVCFSRVERCDVLITQLIDSANESIYVMVYSFTSDPLADALIRAHERGVDVRVVIEGEQAMVRGSEYRRLLESGVAVALDKNPALMHHKAAIIDGYIVVTGSYNWTWSAEERNDENIVIIADKRLASEYTSEFMRVFTEAQH